MANFSSACSSPSSLVPIFDPTEDDFSLKFNPCFFLIAVQLPCYGQLAIVAAYYLGKRETVHAIRWNKCQSFLIYTRGLLVSLLILLVVAQVLWKWVYLGGPYSLVELLVNVERVLSWFLHLLVVLQLPLTSTTYNTRGPRLLIISWLGPAVLDVLIFRNSIGDTQSTSLFLTIILLLQGLYLLTVIPGSSHLDQRQFRSRTNLLHHAYEGQEDESYTGFDEEEEMIPLGVAKEDVGMFSYLIFGWVTPLMKKGACGFLHSSENLFELPPSLSTNQISRNFELGRRSLVGGLHYHYGLRFYSIGLLKLLADTMGFTGPILLNLLVEYVESDTQGDWMGFSYVGGLLASSLVGSLANTHFSMNMAEVNLKIRASLITKIYKKTLNVRKSVMEKYSSGEIINFMSTDVDRIVNFCPSFHAFWSLPAQVGITLYLLYLQIGISFLAGLIFAIVLIPINKVIANKIGTLSTKMMHYKDERVKLMSELLYGIRGIKFYCWEDYFQKRVEAVREKEIRCLKGRKYLDALCVYFWATTPVLVSVLSFGTFVLLGNQLTAAKVFTSIALFNMLISPLNALPWVLNGVVEAWVSVKRISKFLLEEETSPHSVYKPLKSSELALAATDCCFSWGSSSQLDIENFNLTVRKGQFIGIVGSVGSGKTSLLLGLLGELDLNPEAIISLKNPQDGVGLVEQEAWIQRGTIRGNICFSPNSNLKKYKAVVDACCLKEDLNSFKMRDESVVGENGISLSGGQKIRIALARAVYQDLPVYFLDDIFAAVDYKVAKQLYIKCLMGLLKNKTRIVVTHHTEFLRHADWILVMDGGKVIKEGPPSQVLQNGSFEDEGDSDEDEASATEETFPTMVKSIEFSHEELTSWSPSNEEQQQEGSIKFSVFSTYYKAVGPALFWLIILSISAMQASRNASDLWLAHWVSRINDTSTDPDKGTTTTTTTTLPFLQDGATTNNTFYFLKIFLMIGVLNSFFTLLRAFFFAIGGILGAVRVHSSLLQKVLKAHIGFFDATPIGRILNRFSSDVSTIDDSLPFVSNILLAQGFGLLGTMILTCYALPWILVVVIPLLLICNNIQEYYRHTARQLRRIGSISLSPVYAHFSETLKGLVVIRAMRAVMRFEQMNESNLESSQICQYSTQAVSQWLSFRLQLVGVVIVTSVGFLGIFQHHYNEKGIDPGIIGLAISYALTVTNALNGFVTILTETEKEFVAVERACEYIEEVKPEGIISEGRSSVSLPYLWPAQGVIKFEHVSLRYRENLPFVLKSINFETRPAEKLGVCGRTGSGKSSLFACLFHIVHFDGLIQIDNVDINDLDLITLRSELSIIPQDPFLFSGSLRDNLDPLGRASDEAIHRALRKCQLIPTVAALGGLDAIDCAQRLSTGQKQLVCLARAVLKNAKILCIDEATANVDLETDQIIQSTLRTSFAHSTVITIAHRVKSILHCDRVLVMSDGDIVEFDDPTVLMGNHASLFYQLATGSR